MIVKYLNKNKLKQRGENNMNKLKMRIKYFEGATKLKKIAKGNWIDVYARKDVFVPLGERAMIPLGFALELPQGWEGHLAPRSSTFKTWGIIQTNSVGVVDDTYIGDTDEWHMPVYCLKIQKSDYIRVKECNNEDRVFKKGQILEYETFMSLLKQTKYNYDDISDEKKWYYFDDNWNNLIVESGTYIQKGDKIGQFRIMEVMPEIEFDEVESFGNEDRGGFGTTGVK